MAVKSSSYRENMYIETIRDLCTGKDIDDLVVIEEFRKITEHRFPVLRGPTKRAFCVWIIVLTEQVAERDACETFLITQRSLSRAKKYVFGSTGGVAVKSASKRLKPSSSSQGILNVLNY